MRVDNLAVEHWSCPAKYDLRIRRGLVPLRRAPSLSFGVVIHAGLAEWYRTASLDAALNVVESVWTGEIEPGDFRTLEYAKKVLREYVHTYPKESWSPVLVEQTFTLSTGLFCDCVACGSSETELGFCMDCYEKAEPIEYGGIIDLVAEFNGTLYVVDHKTTTQLGRNDHSYFFSRFKPDSQLTGYIWAATQLTNRSVAGAIINAIGLYKTGDVLFARQPTGRNKFEITEWLDGLRIVCSEIRRAEAHGVFRLDTGRCGDYGGCPYRPIHLLGDATARQKKIELDYTMEPWNYEARD